MHWPLFAPVQGMLSTSGRPPGDVSGELGTNSGTQTPVKLSFSSPLGHAATDGAADRGAANAATAGAAAMAAAKPPAIRIRRESCKVAIVTLSVSLLCATRRLSNGWRS